MNINQRGFTGEADKRKMVALSQAFQTENIHVVDLPYRFSSWAFDTPDNIKLWDNAQGQLLAWAVMQTPFWMIDYAYDPTLGRVILLEGLRRLRLHAAEKIYLETDKYRNAALELYKSCGFRVIQDVLVFRKDYYPAFNGGSSE